MPQIIAPVIRFHVTGGPRDGEDVAVGAHRMVVGTDPDCDFTVTDAQVSGEHASLKTIDGQVQVHDLGSRTGTFINDTRITMPTQMGPGDRLKIGSTVLTASLVEDAVAEPPPGVEVPQAPEFAPPPAVPTPAGPSQPPPGKPKRRLSWGWAGLGGVLLLAIIGGVLLAAGAFSSTARTPTKKLNPPVALTSAQISSLDKPGTVLVVSRGTPGSPMVAFNGGNDLLGGGSGWVYDASKGLIVTNAHVVMIGGTVQVGYDQTSLVDAAIVGVDLADDIAVLKVPPAMLPGLKALHGANPASVHQGDTVYALGYPGNSTTGTDFLKTPYQFTNGVISALSARATVDTDPFGLFKSNDNTGVLQPDLYQTTATINPGNSGGALVSSQGLLVGMNVAESGSAQAQGYAIPIAKIDSIVASLAGGSSVGWAGFGAVAVPSSLAHTWGAGGNSGLAPPGGLIITSVTKDTPADQAGLGQAMSDALGKGFVLVLTGINNQPVTSAQQYVDTLKQIPSGASVKISVAALDPKTGLMAVDNTNGYTWGSDFTMKMA